MPTPRKPQDHLAKQNGPASAKSLEELDEYFSFETGGKSYVMPNKTLDVINTGFIRKNRRRDDVDYVLTAIEYMVGARDKDGDEVDPGKEGREILDAFDELTREELNQVMKDFQDHVGASLGE